MPGARGNAIVQVLLAVNAGAFVTAVHADASPVLCSADIAGASLVQVSAMELLTRAMLSVGMSA